MRRRICGDVNTGFGNNSEVMFDNVWSNNEKFNTMLKKMFDEILLHVDKIKEYGGFDFKIKLFPRSYQVNIGIEPTYKYDEYFVYAFGKEKYIKEGKALGIYGSKLKVNSLSKYGDKNFDNNFMQIIDKYDSELKKCLME